MADQNTTLSQKDSINILHLLNKANLGKQLTQNDFLMIKNKLLDHYRELQFLTSSHYQKENIRKAIKIIDKLKYRDYLDAL